MKKKPTQFFHDEYLQSCGNLTPEQIIEFLEGFRELMSEKPEKSKLISIKIRPSLLNAFKAKSAIKGVPYQTQIKKLMQDWLGE